MPAALSRGGLLPPDLDLEMMMSEFYEGLAEILEVEPDDIDADFELTGDNWDSLAVVSTIALIDDVYDVAIHPNKLAEAKTVGEIDELVAAEQQG